MTLKVLYWLATLFIAFMAGKAVSKLKLPAILGWLIAGMILGPNALGLLPSRVLDSTWYKLIIIWMQCAFGLMLGTELVWRRIKNYGKSLIVTTLTQSLGTFALVSLVFGIVFKCVDIPVYLAFVFGGIALATAPAPALSIVNEFHTKGLLRIPCSLWQYWMILWELQCFLQLIPLLQELYQEVQYHL